MALLGTIPPLYWVTLVVVGVSVWAHDVRGFFLAALTFAIGTVQYLRNTAPGDRQDD